MPESQKTEKSRSAREQFLSLGLKSTRKSYYPQLRKQLEVLKENERRIRLLVDNLPALISYVDAEKRYVFVNLPYQEKLGLDRIGIVGQYVRDVVGDENYRRLAPHMDAALSGRHVRFEDSFVTRKGERHWLEVHYVPDVTSQKGVAGFYVLALDVTEKRQADQELAESEARYRIIADNITDVITVFDRFGKITFTTPSHKRVMGRGEEVVGRDALEFIHPEDIPKTKAFLDHALESGGAEHLEFRYLSPIRGYVWLESVGKLIDMRGEPSCLVVTRDITERKQSESFLREMEKRLQQSHKMEAIGTLAGGIAHDFNNILSSVLGFADLARLDLENRKKTGEYLDGIIDAGLRARDLVRQILTFARQADMKKEPVALSPLIKEALKFLRASLPVTVDIRSEFSAPEARVLADPTQVHQIIMNLCTNAAQAMKETGGVVDVQLSPVVFEDATNLGFKNLKPGPYLKLVIADTGCGIQPEIIDKIFDPFFTTKERGEGTGMGLSMVHGIVGDMGGAVSVESKPGRGTAFQIFFPEHAEQEASAAAADAPVETGNGKILFVDDEKAIITTGRGILEHCGYQVATATNPLQALEMFEAAPGAFDLVLTDMTMQEMTGIELSEKLLEIRPDIPIILCTGFSLGMSAQRARALGIRDLVMKPMVAGELIAAVRSAMTSDSD